MRRHPCPRRAAAAALLAAALGACAAPPSIRVQRTTDLDFPPKASDFEVEVLREFPAREYLEIASLSAGGGYHQTTDAVLGRLRERAALLGADALVVTRETYRDEGVFRAGPPRSELYGVPGPPSAIRDEPDPGALRTPWVEARAIRYATP
jgi:hypothetical protein